VKAMKCEALIALGLLAAVAVALPPSVSAQQVRRVAPPEGVPRLLVTPFRSTEKGVGADAADEVRQKVQSDIGIKKLFVIPKAAVCANLEASGFSCDSTPDPITSKLLATQLRADEYVEGTVTRQGGAYRLETRMVLTRDNNMVQPLPPVTGNKLGNLADQVSKSLQAARKQLPDERKCELAVAAGNAEQAEAAARAAIAAYPQSTIGRVCLAQALDSKRQKMGASGPRPGDSTAKPADSATIARNAAAGGANAPASGPRAALNDSIIAITSQVLAIDPRNKPALNLAAQAYKDAGNVDKAVQTWTQLLAADPKNTRLVQDVTNYIAASGKAPLAKPIITKAVAENPGDPDLLRLKWLILLATKDWKDAISTGEELAKSDTAAADSTFFIRLAAAYAADSQPQKAAETTARGVAKFPKNATLWSLNSQTLRLAGQTQKAVEAANTALQINPKTEHAWMRKAQAQIDLGQTDSAITSLKQAAANGEDKATIGQFLLVLGNKAYKEAADTSHPPKIEDFQRAMTILASADSITPTPQGKFVLGVSAFRVGDLAVRANQKQKSCDQAKLAQDSFVTAQINIAAGGSIDPKTSQQLLAALQQYDPAVKAQVKKFCK